ncbi:MAG: glycosyltransferase [Candidatus Nanopusillus acidilobi]|jgi:GT2 family glycosyltransferase
MCKLAALITSYNRSELFRKTLNSWLEKEEVDTLIVKADSSKREEYERYKETLEKVKDKSIIYEVSDKKSGPTTAKNRVLEMALQNGCKFMIYADDDHYIPIDSDVKGSLRILLNESIGAVGGKIVNLSNRSVDPDFFLNLAIAEPLSKALGYIFLDVKHGPRFAEFVPAFFMVENEAVNNVRYDEFYDTTNGFREESDFQQGIKRAGYKLVFNPYFYVYHIPIEEGGDRGVSLSRRIFGKSKANTYFSFKWYSKPRAIWYVLASSILLMMYSPSSFSEVLKGIKDGIKEYQVKRKL